MLSFYTTIQAHTYRLLRPVGPVRCKQTIAFAHATNQTGRVKQSHKNTPTVAQAIRAIGDRPQVVVFTSGSEISSSRSSSLVDLESRSSRLYNLNLEQECCHQHVLSYTHSEGRSKVHFNVYDHGLDVAKCNGLLMIQTRSRSRLGLYNLSFKTEKNQLTFYKSWCRSRSRPRFSRFKYQ